MADNRIHTTTCDDEDQDALTILRVIRDSPMKNAIQEMINDVPPLIIRTTDIPRSMQYQPLIYGQERCALHVGQLKLFLSEVQFMTDHVPGENTYCRNGSLIYVIYVGSGPGHTRQMLADMFPHVKFIFIDPREHNIMCSDTRDCLYFRTSTATSFPDHEIDVATSSGIVKQCKGKAISATDMLSPCDIARAIMNTKCYTYYIIEDFFTCDMAQSFAKLGASGNKVYFISDIRTHITNVTDDVSIPEEDNDSPSDLDIIVNNAWQHMWVNIIRPEACMLKFRTPFMNHSDIGIINRCSGSETFDGAEALRSYTAMFRVDLLKEYSAHRYIFMDNDYMNVQSFAGPSSTEVRLIATPRRYNVLREYVIAEHEDKMFYYNTMREFCFSEVSRPHFDSVPGLDGCIDCRLAMTILSRYATMHNNAIPTGRKVTAILLLQQVLCMIQRTIKSRFHGQFFAPYRDIQHVLRSIISRRSAADAAKIIAQRGTSSYAIPRRVAPVAQPAPVSANRGAQSRPCQRHPKK